MFKNMYGKIRVLVCLIVILLLISILFFSFQANEFVVDSVGRNVAIKDYKRIGVINPAAIKTMIFLGFDFSKVAAVDSYSIFKYKQNLSSKTENLGDFNNPNIEVIVKNNIDLLILDQSFSVQKLQEIEKLNIPYFVYSTSPASYKAISDNLYNLSRILKKDKEFEKLKINNITSYEKNLLLLKDKFNNKSIIFIVWADKNITVAGSDSYLAYLAEFCGFKNIINEKGWINISFEKLLILDPDYIIVASSYVDKGFFNNNIFANLKAVKNKTIYFFSQTDEDIILQPSFDLWKGFYDILIKFTKS